MSFDDFMTDSIIVRKQNGDVLEGLKASVQRDAVFLNRSDVLVADSTAIRPPIP